MTIIQKINDFFKKKARLFPLIDTKVLRIEKFNPFIVISFLLIFSSFFFISSTLIENKNTKNANSLKEIAKSNEFSNLSNYFISKISSPYRELDYVIKNNDTVEKILKNFKVQDEDIKIISVKLKQKKLGNIYVRYCRICRRIQ